MPTDEGHCEDCNSTEHGEGGCDFPSSPLIIGEDVCKCHGVRRVNKGTHMSCRVKHREQNLRAVKRYQAKSKGMLTRVRDNAKQRGNR